jgi:succinyl-CoA synthetase alpha subunit
VAPFFLGAYYPISIISRSGNLSKTPSSAMHISRSGNIACIQLEGDQ